MDNVVKAAKEPVQEQLTRHLIDYADKYGSIPLDIFMQTVLSHPEYGYYAQGQKIGADGDFITAPEISQLFGEIAAGFLGHIWTLYGKPTCTEISIFEAGPGNGTLLCDMLRLYNHHQLALADSQIILLEKSPFHQEKIIQNLAHHGFMRHTKPQFITSLDQLPPCPIFGIANEFFDALGVTQAIFTPSGWCWHEVVADKDEAFALTPTRPLTADEIATYNLPETANLGDIQEFSAASTVYLEQFARHIARYGGALLIADYGKSDGKGNSLQAVKNHGRHDFFEDIGSADLTHLVDFSALAKTAMAAGARLVGPVSQADFLTELGIMQRAESLRHADNPEQDRMLIAALDRLTSPAQMGQIFKIACLIPQGEGLPPGFSTAP